MTQSQLSHVSLGDLKVSISNNGWHGLHSALQPFTQWQSLRTRIRYRHCSLARGRVGVRVRVRVRVRVGALLQMHCLRTEAFFLPNHGRCKLQEMSQRNPYRSTLTWMIQVGSKIGPKILAWLGPPTIVAMKAPSRSDKLMRMHSFEA